MTVISSQTPLIGDATSHTSDSVAFDLIGDAKHILIVGGIASSLPQLLDSKGCELTFVLPSAVRSDEARVYSSHVEVANLDDVNLSSLFPDRKFDAIVLDAAETTFPTASHILDGARRMLSEQGRVVGLMPNARHGAIRLALLRGLLAGDTFDDVAPELKRFTLEGICRLFLQTGYDIEIIEPVTHRIFEASDLLPPLDRAQFSEALVREVEADSDALMVQFVVSALPSTDANGDRTADLEQVLAEARERATERCGDIVPFAPRRDEAPLNAELEGTRRQAALNAAAAARARLEIVGLQSRVEELKSQLAESQGALQEQAVAMTGAGARQADMVARIHELEAALENATTASAEVEGRNGDMVARIHELEEVLQNAVATSATELEARTADLVARIGELEGLLLASDAETGKARVKVDSARASLHRRNTYIAHLAAVQDSTQTMLRQANASAEGLQMQLARANAAAEKRSAAIEQLQNGLIQSNDRVRALTETLKNRSRIIVKLEDARLTVQAQLDRATAVLDERSMRVNALELSEVAARLELRVVRTDLTSRLGELEKRARAILAEERARSASLEEALHHAHEELVAVVTEKGELQRTAERAVEDLAGVRSEVRILEESNQNTKMQHERDLAEMNRSLDELGSELASVKAANAEIPILTVRAVTSEKRLEMLEAQLLEMTKRARGLEDDLLAAVSRELQLQRDVTDVGEHALRVESDFQSAARHAEQMEHELEEATLHSALQGEQLAEAIERAARQEERLQDTLQRCSRLELLEPQLHELSDRVKQLEGELVAAAGNEDQLQHDAWQIGEHARRIEADLEQSNQRARQLEEELQKITHLALQRDKEALEAMRRSERQEERLAETSRRCVRHETELDETLHQCTMLSNRLADASQRCEQLANELAEVHSSRTWKIATRLERVLKPWRS